MTTGVLMGEWRGASPVDMFGGHRRMRWATLWGTTATPPPAPDDGDWLVAAGRRARTAMSNAAKLFGTSR